MGSGEARETQTPAVTLLQFCFLIQYFEEALPSLRNTPDIYLKYISIYKEIYKMINIIIYKAESLTRYSENGAFALHLQQYWWQCVSSFMWFPRVCGFLCRCWKALQVKWFSLVIARWRLFQKAVQMSLKWIDREPSGVMWSRCKLREPTEKNERGVEAEGEM